MTVVFLFTEPSTVVFPAPVMTVVIPAVTELVPSTVFETPVNVRTSTLVRLRKSPSSKPVDATVTNTVSVSAPPVYVSVLVLRTSIKSFVN